MDSIVIPPPAFRDTPMMASQHRHLLLSHLVQDQSYRDFYRARRQQGDYLILDNSAHEHGEGESFGTLLTQAKSLRVQEVVIPDVLFDRQKTLDRALESFSHLLDTDPGDTYIPSSWMIVPQGSDLLEWRLCLKLLVSYITTTRDSSQDVIPKFTIGVSKDYSAFDPDLMTCLTDAFSYGVPVHLLGWPKPLGSLNRIARRFGRFIRSTDSGRPFTFALAGIRLHHLSLDEVVYPGRQHDFFHRQETTPDEVELADFNVNLYRSLCRLP